MPNTDMIAILNQLQTRLNDNRPTTQVDVDLSSEQKKEVNYEVMYALLYNRVEKFIMENSGNQVVDNLRDNLVNDLAPAVKHLLGR
jgi:hypothetical protein